MANMVIDSERRVTALSVRSTLEGRRESDAYRAETTEGTLKKGDDVTRLNQKRKPHYSNKYRLSMKTRGISLIDDAPTAAASEEPDDNTAIIPFWLKHDLSSH